MNNKKNNFNNFVNLVDNNYNYYGNTNINNNKTNTEIDKHVNDLVKLYGPILIILNSFMNLSQQYADRRINKVRMNNIKF